MRSIEQSFSHLDRDPHPGKLTQFLQAERTCQLGHSLYLVVARDDCFVSHAGVRQMRSASMSSGVPFRSPSVPRNTIDSAFRRPPERRSVGRTRHPASDHRDSAQDRALAPRPRNCATSPQAPETHPPARARTRARNGSLCGQRLASCRGLSERREACRRISDCGQRADARLREGAEASPRR